MADERLVTIAQRLLALTQEGKLRWQPAGKPAEGPASSFGARLASGTAVVASSDPEGRYPYSLRIFDDHGADLGRLETGEDAERWLGDGEADPWEQAVCGLYAEARKVAVAPEAALDKILTELKSR